MKINIIINLKFNFYSFIKLNWLDYFLLQYSIQYIKFINLISLENVKNPSYLDKKNKSSAKTRDNSKI